MQLTLDRECRVASFGASHFQLTPRERDLLAMLMGSPNVIVSQNRVMEDAWGWEEASGRASEYAMHLERLIGKLASIGCPEDTVEDLGAGCRYNA